MAIYSQYNYIAPSELPLYIHSMSSVTDEVVAARFISDAERIIDAYVGPAPSFYIPSTGYTSQAIASGSTAFYSGIWGSRRPNYWGHGGVYVELLDIDGTANSHVGDERLIVGSQNGVVFLASGFDIDLPVNTLFNFRCRSRFPRWWDQTNAATPRMPPELKRAAALQVEYGFLFGSEQFGLSDPAVGDGELAEIQSRSYGGGYAESRAVGAASHKQGLAYLIGPRVRAELRTVMNSTGFLRG